MGLNKVLSWLLTVALVMGSVPTQALAAGLDDLNDVVSTNVSDVGTDVGNGGDLKDKVSVVVTDDGAAAVVNGDAVDDSGVVADALVAKGMDETLARRASVSLMAAGDDGAKQRSSSDMPRSGDGSNVEALSLWWVTPDTVDNNDPDLLYVKPTADEKQQVRMRLNYALSGEFDYMAGDIRITVPDQMFSYRDGEAAGTFVIPYPESPDASQDFMWEHVDGAYVLTNTRRMSAATKGFMEFAVTGLVPHRLVDMAPSADFGATIEVTTHYGNLIGLTSNELVAQFDTEQVVDATYKRQYGNVRWVSADAIPEGQRIAGEDEYVVVNWDVYGHHWGNTEFTLDVLDEILDEYHGFVIGASADDEAGTRLYEDVESGWMTNGTFGHMTIRTAYPGSQFLPDTDYLFENKVTYTLTEADPTLGDDEQKVTHCSATAQVPFRWHKPVFKDPEGHFMMNKIGNDGAFGRDSAPYWSRSYSYLSSGKYKGLDVTHKGGFFHNTDDGFGIYTNALNELVDGNDVEVAYTVESEGWMAPWQVDTTMDIRKAEAYGRRPVAMVTYDTDWTSDKRLYLDGGESLEWGEDWTYRAVEFPMRPDIGRLVAVNLDENGGFVAEHAGDGTFEYEEDKDDTHQPYIQLDGWINGDWVHLATARWVGSSYEFVCENGALATGRRVILPDGVERTRTYVSTTNAYLFYYVRPILSIHASDHVVSVANDLFANSNTPSVGLHNTASMYAYDADTQPIVDFHKSAKDELRGYSTEIAVHPTKVGEQDIGDIDFSKHEIRIHYTARAEERSLIGDKAIYDGAVKDGRIIPETRGVWRDLLPEGVYPDMETVALRSGDTILDAYTIENWRGSNRTMLVVEAALTPKLETYEYGSKYDVRLMDVPTLTFDGIYSFEDLRDFGADIHNVVSFESLAKDEIGNYPDWSGEADDPYGTGNIATSTAFLDDDERKSFESLDDDRDTPSFVYAGATTKIDALAAARTSLSKDIQVNNDGRWSQGTYNDHRYVYEGGQYTYRLRTMSDADTETRDIVVYDSFENFHAGNGNDEADIDAPRWQGYFRDVNLTQLREMGVNPVVYYSTVENLQLSDEHDALKAHTTNTKLDNADVWVPADEYEGSLDDVRAIAVDCTTDVNGDPFVLDEFESISFVVRMQAPSGEDARLYCSQKGVWGESAHAYNNAYMLCTSIDKSTGVADSDNFVRKDYTKVGIKEHNYTVEKTWIDDRDRDGMRPDSITMHLLADGADTGITCELSEDNGWKSVFEHIPYTDADGNKIRYSVSEDAVEGYTFMSSHVGTSLFAINSHECETTTVSGHKTWVDADGVIPESIRVTVLMDGTEWETKTVTDDGTGTWAYSFENLPKYRDHGRLIEWTVAESGVSKSFVATVNGYDIENRYHPFGDLSVSKTVHGASSGFAGQAFPVMVMLTDANGSPVPGSFEWTSTAGTSGEISSGGTLEIHGGEVITVHEIPEYCDYEIVEADVDGYDLVGDGLVGVVEPNDVAEAHLDNYYHAEGSAQIRVAKTLEGRDMERYQFRFELVDADGNVVRTGSNQANGAVVFGAINYTEADAGNTYEYTIREVDRGVGGYTYDGDTYRATVSVTDLGNGRVQTETHVFDKDGVEVTGTPSFDNTYHAEGEVKLRAWKRLRGDTLADGQFSFVVEDAAGNEVATATNTAAGDVVSSAIEFDETNANERNLYVMYEVEGDDDKMVYDNSAFGYVVEVTDDGQGHMVCTQDYVAVRRDGDGWVEDDSAQAEVPVFVNELLPGELAIEKTTSGDVPEGHENDEFTFRVKLVGDNVPSSINYELEPISGSGDAPAPGGFALASVWDSLFGVRKAYAAEAGSDDRAIVSIEKCYANGGEFADGSSVYVRKRTAPESGSAVSHTQNISDGEQKSNYGDYWSNNHIRGTGRSAALANAHVVSVPGAESVKVVVEYGGESTSYDWVRIWKGSHPEYTANDGADDADLIVSKLGGTHGTKTYTVEGDTVTFAFRSDSSGSGDGFGYSAVVLDAALSDDDLVADDREIPTRDGYVLNGWNTKADGTGRAVSGDDFVGGTLYAQWIRSDVSYDANGGTFSDGSSRLDMTYAISDGGPVAVSHTDNVSDTGEQLGNLSTGGNAHIVGTGRPEGNSDAHVVRVGGAQKLLVDITYAFPSSSYGAAIWQGSRPNRSVSSYTGDSLSGVLSSSGHRRYVVDGDTVTFSYYTNTTSSNSASMYGYYATVTPIVDEGGASLEVPTREGYGFAGWNSKADGSGTSVPGDDGMLYAQWESTVTTYDANGGSFAGGGTTNVVTYDMISRARVSHTANMNDAGIASGPTTASGNSYIRGWERTESSSYGHVLSIPGADATRLTIRYDTGSSSNYVSVLNRRSNTSSSSASTTDGRIGQLSGRGEKTFDVANSDVTLLWYMGDKVNVSDGYYATLDYPREAVSGTYAEPVREGYRFVGWDTAADGSDGVPAVSGGTLYAQWEESSLTFDANGGSFADGATTKDAGNGNPFAYVVVQSDNRNAAGVAEYSYRNDFDAGHTYDVKSVSVPGADSLNVRIGGKTCGYDSVYVIPGNYQGDIVRSGSNSTYPDNVTGQLYKSTSSEFSYSGTVPSNAVSFGLYGYNPSYSGGYPEGYRATITLPNQPYVQNPTRDGYRFVGWNTAPDGSGDAWCDGTGTMYAQWARLGGECGGVSWAIDDSGTLRFWPTNGVSGTFEYPDDGHWPWLKYLATSVGVTNVYVEPGVVACENMSYFLDIDRAEVNLHPGYTSLNTTIKSVDVTNMDVSQTKNMSHMFANLYNAENIDIEGWDTSNVTNFSYWLYCGNSTDISVDLSELDLGSAENMSYMFANRANTYKLDLSVMDTGNVTRMQGMFSKAVFDADDLSDWDVSSVTNMSNMFDYAKAEDKTGKAQHMLDFARWDVSSVNNMSSMFRYWDESDEPVEVLIDNWDTSNVTSMEYMFCGEHTGEMNPVFCDLSKLEVGSVTNFNYMFYLNDAFRVVDISNWDMSSARYTYYMIGTSSSGVSNYYANHGARGTAKIIFGEGCNLPYGNSVGFSGQSSDGKWRRIDETDEDRISGDELGKLSNADTGDRERFVGTWVASKLATVAVLDADGNLTFVNPVEPVTERDSEHTDVTVTSVGGTEYTGHVDVDFISNRSSYRVYLFNDQASDVKRVSVDKDSTVDFAYDTGMYGMFRSFSNMESFDGNGFNTSNQTSFYNLFYYCRALSDVDVSSWDTSSVKSFESTFDNCRSLPTLDLGNWDTSSATSMTNMFYQCNALSDLVGVESFDVGKVTSFGSMFTDCDRIVSMDLSDWNTSSATSMYMMFNGMDSLESLNVDGWDTSNVTSMCYLSDTSNVGYGIFSYCRSLKSLDLSSWNVDKVGSFAGMFYYCTSLEDLDISSFGNMDNNKYRCNMFSGDSVLKSVTLGEGFDFTKASGASYSAILPTPPSSTTTGKWVNLEKDATNALTPTQLRDTYDGSDESMVGTWVWQLAQKQFSFDANGGMGRMDGYAVLKNTVGMLPACTFTFFDHDFVGWNTEPDGSGESYADGAVINYTANEAQDVHLYAQWQQRDHSVGIEDGTFTVTVPAGYRVRVTDLPAGVSYIVTEESASQPGWSLEDSDNTAGAIRSTETSVAGFVNAYTPDVVKVRLGAVKTLDGVAPESGAFGFTLSRDGEVIDTKECGVAGTVSFDELTFTEPGTYIYRIAEVAGSDETIAYDDHESVAVVVVTEGEGGVLSADVTYGVSVPETVTSGESTYAVGDASAWVGSISSQRLSGLDGEPLKMADFSAAEGGSKTSGGFEMIDGLYVVSLATGPFTAPGSDVTHVGDVVTIAFDDGTSIRALVGNVQARPGVDDPYDASSFDEVVIGAGPQGRDYASCGWGHVVSGHANTVEFWGFNGLSDPMTQLRNETGGQQTRIVSITNHGMSREFAAFEPVSEAAGVVSMMTLAGSSARTTPTFANRHLPGSLTVSKSVSGVRDASAADTFDIVVSLTGPDGLPLTSAQVIGEDEARTSSTGTYTLSLAGNSSATFANLAAGTRWSVSEPNLGAGWANSGITNATGEVSSAVASAVSVSNVYSATGEATIQAHKRLVGRVPVSGEFAFELLDESGEVIDRAESGAPDTRDTVVGEDGETAVANPHRGCAPVTFGTLTYDTPGTYHYRVREVAGTDESVEYSNAVLGVTVTVTDAGNGQLRCEVAYDGGTDIIENVVRTGSLTVSKSIVGATEAAQGASFDVTVELTDAGGTSSVEGTFDAVVTHGNGSTETSQVTFVNGIGHVSLSGGDSVSIDGLAHGTRYRVYERDLESCWSVDSENATTGSVTGDGNVSASITNRYKTEGTFSLEATKAVEDLELVDGAYRFEVRDNDGRVVASAANVGGSVSFSGMEIDPSWAGSVRTYTVSEVAGTDASVLYDDHEETVSVAFSDDGHGHLSAQATYDSDGCTFTNVHNPGWLRVSKASSVPGVTDREGYSLSGARFEVLDSSGTVVGTLTSGDDGLTEELELDPGAYMVREVGAPSGFEVNTGLVRGRVVGGTHVTLTVTDEPQRGSISVTKRSLRPDTTNGNESYDLGGATYAVFETEDEARSALAAALAGEWSADDFNEVATVVLVANADNTEASGTADGLLMGTYWVVEVVGGTRYRIADEVWEAVVTANSVTSIGENGVVFDAPNSGYLNLEKVLGL